MKTSELTGAQLDFWVAKAEGRAVDYHDLGAQGCDFVTVVDQEQSGWVSWSPSRVWADGGPIIEREEIAVACVGLPPLNWQALVRGSERFVYGDTPLVAAMRAYVTSKFGEELPESTG